MSHVSVDKLDLGQLRAINSNGDGIIELVEGLHNYVWIAVLTSNDDLVNFRFEVVDGRLVLKSDTYTDAVTEIEAACQKASLNQREWLATMISQPIPGVGRLSPGVVAIGDSIQVGLNPAYGLNGLTHDVDLGTVESITLYS